MMHIHCCDEVDREAVEAEIREELSAASAGADPEPRTFACCPHDDLYDPKQHTEDGHGGCVICHFYVPHTDEEFERVRWPCAEARAQGGPSLDVEHEYRSALADIMGLTVDYLDDPRMRIIHKVASRAVDLQWAARLGVAPEPHD